MYRLLVVVFFTLGFLPSLSSAVEIKNIRPCYGPFGATRLAAQCLPGDVLFMSYDIDALVINPKTGKVTYTTELELLDSKGASLFKSPTEHDVVPPLGGTRMPGDLHVIMGAKQPAGKYSIRLTVRDKNGVAANDKVFKYDFTVLDEAFGFVSVGAPAVGFVNQRYVTQFGLVNLKLDGKAKPNAELTIKVIDDNTKAVVDTLNLVFPRDLPEKEGSSEKIDLKEANVIPLAHTIFLNRPGQFTIELSGHDKNSGAKVQMRYPVTVIDVGSVGK